MSRFDGKVSIDGAQVTKADIDRDAWATGPDSAAWSGRRLAMARAIVVTTRKANRQHNCVQ